MFFSSFSEPERDDYQAKILSELDEFLRKHFEIEPVVFYSYFKREKHDQIGHIRKIWNKQYSTPDYYEIAKNYFVENKKLERKDIQIFSWAKNENEVCLGLVSKENPFENEFLSYLEDFLKKQFEKTQSLLRLMKYESLAYLDDITGLYNQRRLVKDLDYFCNEHEERERVFSIIFIDVDHFKNVNDGHGHLIGTNLLSAIADVLRENSREGDLIYRYGGDEFVVLVPDSDSDMSHKIGERILTSIKTKDFKVSIGENYEPESFNLSVSIGIADYPSDASNSKEILNIADKMMYKAKDSGRGQVCRTRDLLDS